MARRSSRLRALLDLRPRQHDSAPTTPGALPRPQLPARRPRPAAVSRPSAVLDAIANRRYSSAMRTPSLLVAVLRRAHIESRSGCYYGHLASGPARDPAVAAATDRGSAGRWEPSRDRRAKRLLAPAPRLRIRASSARRSACDVGDQYTSFVPWEGDRVVTTLVRTRAERRSSRCPSGVIPVVGAPALQAAISIERGPRPRPSGCEREGGYDVCVSGISRLLDARLAGGPGDLADAAAGARRRSSRPCSTSWSTRRLSYLGDTADFNEIRRAVHRAAGRHPLLRPSRSHGHASAGQLGPAERRSESATADRVTVRSWWDRRAIGARPRRDPRRPCSHARGRAGPRPARRIALTRRADAVRETARRRMAALPLQALSTPPRWPRRRTPRPTRVWRCSGTYVQRRAAKHAAECWRRSMDDLDGDDRALARLVADGESTPIEAFYAIGRATGEEGQAHRRSRGRPAPPRNGCRASRLTVPPRTALARRTLSGRSGRRHALLHEPTKHRQAGLGVDQRVVRAFDLESRCSGDRPRPTSATCTRTSRGASGRRSRPPSCRSAADRRNGAACCPVGRAPSS